jgi:hypothetical protein
MLTDTFAGIAPAGVPGFIAAQFAAVVALHLVTRLGPSRFTEDTVRTRPP